MVQRFYRAFALSCVALAAVSCARKMPAAAVPANPLKAANTSSKELGEEISSQIADQYAAVSDLKATVMMSATLGRQQRGKVKRYAGIRGYLLFRKPASIRIIGSGPMFVGNAFDLSSDGSEFRISIPSRKRFVIGPNDYVGRSDNKLENIRPQHLMEVLLPKPVDPGEAAALEEGADGSSYTLRLMRANPEARPSRTLTIDSANLRVTREIIFTAEGRTLTDARFSQWIESEDTLFPGRIEINRPQEEYQLVIQTQKIEINRRLGAEVFVLEQPPGTQLVRLGQPGEPPEAANPR
jgi:outer membrane lipoprotein-sorting protein